MSVSGENIFGIISFLVGIIVAGVPAYIVVFGKLNNIQGQLSQLMYRLDIVDKHGDKIGQIKTVLVKHKKDIDGLGNLIRTKTQPSPTDLRPRS